MKDQDLETSHVEEPNTEGNVEKPLFAKSIDVATQLVDNAVAGNISPEQDRECLRRIDRFLMPVMFLSFAFQYMDKACLTGAALFGILTDLNLVQL